MTPNTEQDLNIQIKADNLFDALDLTTKELYARADEIEEELTQMMNGPDHSRKFFYFQTWKSIQRLKQKLRLFSRERVLTV